MSSSNALSFLFGLVFLLITTTAVVIFLRHNNGRKNEGIRNLVSQRVSGGMLLPLVSPFLVTARKAADRLVEKEGGEGVDQDDNDKKKPRLSPFPVFMLLEIQDFTMSKMDYLLSLVEDELSTYAEALSPFGITLADFRERCDAKQAKETKRASMPVLRLRGGGRKIRKLFSRISVALAKTNAVTLDDLLRVIQSAYTPAPVTCTVENIYDVKSWLRDYIAKFQHHSQPHAFRFKLNDKGEVEMTYRHWAKARRKEWYPEEGPFIVLKEIPPGKPAVLKPDLKKCATVKVMKESIEKLKIRMSTTEREWWKEMIEEEEQKVKLWDSLTTDDYKKAGQTFDLLDFKYSEPEPDQQEDDSEYIERNDKLLQLIEKKENVKPVKLVKEAKQTTRGNKPLHRKGTQKNMKTKDKRILKDAN